MLAVAAQAQQYVFRVFRQPEGLNNLAVNGMASDHAGFLWLATENGVFRFLGSGFERFGPEQGIAEQNVHDIFADPSGALWAGTAENLYRWDGQRFQPASRESVRIAGPRCIAAEDASHLLVVEDGRLLRLEHDAAGRILASSPVFSLRLTHSLPDLKQVARVSVADEGPAGRTVWIGAGNRLYSIPAERMGSRIEPGDGAVTDWGKEQGLPEELWESVLLDHSGTLWVAGQHHIMVLLHGSARFVDRSIPGSDPENIDGHAPMVEDREGRVIVAAEGGVARWEGTRWQSIGRENGLTHTSRLSALIFDAAGDLWIGSLGGGLYGWMGYNNWEGWSEAQMLPSSAIWSIVQAPDGRILVGTEHGPAWVDPRSGASGKLFAGSRWTLGQVGAMGIARDGSLWGGTFSGGFLQLDSRTGRMEKTSTLPTYIYGSVEYPAGHLYLTTRHGIWESENGAVPHRIDAAEVLLGGSDRVDTGCVTADGSVWFLAQSRLLRLKDGVWSTPAIDGIRVLHDPLIAVTPVRDGSLWVTGQQTGTWHLTPHGDRLQASELHLPKEYGELAPLSILMDQRGWLWIGSDQGLVVWNGKDWRHLTQESGLIWNDINQGVMSSGSDGSLWVGTSGGLAHLIHPERVFDKAQLSVAVTLVQRDRESYSTTKSITLPWSEMPLRFQISSPTERNRSELVFKYRMEGLQRDWNNNLSGMAEYHALPPGQYTFLAVAFNPGLNAQSETVRISLRILSPWWRSYWFYAFCVLILAVGAYFFDRLRAHQLRERSRLLESQVSERTRELEFSREQLRVQASHDALTGMLNRRGILKALNAEMERARREKGSLVVALVDLDHFKRINDSYGHLAGDEALRWFAAAVGAAVRSYDHAGRYGGEEFLLILAEVPEMAAEQRLARLHAAISNLQVHTRECEFRVTSSIGATIFEGASEIGSLESVLAIADQALYEAKAAGRNRVILRRLNIANDRPV